MLMNKSEHNYYPEKKEKTLKARSIYRCASLMR
jgi:hypothetical protein